MITVLEVQASPQICETVGRDHGISVFPPAGMGSMQAVSIEKLSSRERPRSFAKSRRRWRLLRRKQQSCSSQSRGEPPAIGGKHGHAPRERAVATTSPCRQFAQEKPFFKRTVVDIDNAELAPNKIQSSFVFRATRSWFRKEGGWLCGFMKQQPPSQIYAM